MKEYLVSISTKSKKQVALFKNSKIMNSSKSIKKAYSKSRRRPKSLYVDTSKVKQSEEKALPSIVASEPSQDTSPDLYDTVDKEEDKFNESDLVVMDKADEYDLVVMDKAEFFAMTDEEKEARFGVPFAKKTKTS